MGPWGRCHWTRNFKHLARSLQSWSWVKLRTRRHSMLWLDSNGFQCIRLVQRKPLCDVARPGNEWQKVCRLLSWENCVVRVASHVESGTGEWQESVIIYNFASLLVARFASVTSIFFIIQNPLTVLLWQEFFADRDVLNKMFVFKKESWHFF
jgi:hypothetical protein